MLHAPISEKKTRTESSRTQQAEPEMELERQVPPFDLGRPLRQSSMGSGESADTSFDRHRAQLAKVQQTYGNQAVLRIVGRSQPAASPIQTKLMVSQPGDEYEQEADRVAEQMMRIPEPQLKRTCDCCSRYPRFQNEHAEYKYWAIQRVRADNIRHITMPSVVHQVLHSPGESLNSNARAFFEPRFGHDFSNVRVHADAQASDAAQAIRAKAFTVGQDMVFGAGQYAPETNRGRSLLAHELTHVVQQSSKPMMPERTETDTVPVCAALTDTESDINTRVNASLTAVRNSTVSPSSGLAVAQEVFIDTGKNEGAPSMEHAWATSPPYSIKRKETGILLRQGLSSDPSVQHILHLQRTAGGCLLQAKPQVSYPWEQQPVCIGWSVPLIRQPNPWGCWAASFAMMYVWKFGQPKKEQGLLPFEEGTSYTEEEVRENVGRGDYIHQYILAALRAGTRSDYWTKTYQNRKGLDDTNVNKFLKETGLKAAQLGDPDDPVNWLNLLKLGPLMVGALTEEKTGMHAQVIIGLDGGTDPANTVIHINDPARGGERRTWPFAKFIDLFKTGGRKFKASQVYHW